MSQPFPGFIGPSYELENKYASIERTVNWYLVANEAQQEESKFQYMFMPCPGNAQFGTLPVPAPFNQPNRGLIEVRGKCFGVNGNRVFEIFSDGSYGALGGPPTIADDGQPVSMVANGNRQIFIASAGKGYVIDAIGGLNEITTADFLGASFATFQDGYILTVVPNSNQNQISGSSSDPLGNALAWDAANVIVQAGQADFQRAIISSREYVRMLGHRRSQVYQNVGNQGIGGFPFQSYNETFIETGIAAPFSLAEMGDSLIWIGEDARGQRACWRDAAFQPQRISTFAVEQFWQGYSSIADAIAFPFIWQGHLFYQVTFPSAAVDSLGNKTPATWLYDATVSALKGRAIWTERAYMPQTGVQQGRAEVTHAFCFDRHLVGSSGTDGNPGAIYQYSNTADSDIGLDPITGAQISQPVVCDRICPHIYQLDQNIVYNRITFEVARGVGNAVDPGQDPQMLLRWSNDGGENFGTEYAIALGRQGEYAKRVYMNRLGYAKRGGGGRVFWARCADPVFNSLVAAQLDFFACAP